MRRAGVPRHLVAAAIAASVAWACAAASKPVVHSASATSRRFVVSLEGGCPVAAPPEGGPVFAECQSIRYPARYECIEVTRSSTPNLQITVEADQEFLIVPKQNQPDDLWDTPPAGSRNKWKFKLDRVQYPPGSDRLTYAFTIRSVAGNCERDPVIIINR
jgi:hypothetical protein